MIFSIESKGGEKVFYKHDISLKDFQVQMLKNKNESFYYEFKDTVLSIEDGLIKNVFNNGSGKEVLIIVRLMDDVLFSQSIDVGEICEDIIKQKEMGIYFVFEKHVKVLISEISKRHQALILSNPHTVTQDDQI